MNTLLDPVVAKPHLSKSKIKKLGDESLARKYFEETIKDILQERRNLRGDVDVRKMEKQSQLLLVHCPLSSLQAQATHPTLRRSSDIKQTRFVPQLHLSLSVQM